MCEGIVSGSSCQGLFMVDRLRSQGFPNPHLFNLFLHLIMIVSVKKIKCQSQLRTHKHVAHSSLPACFLAKLRVSVSLQISVSFVIIFPKSQNLQGLMFESALDRELFFNSNPKLDLQKTKPFPAFWQIMYFTLELHCYLNKKYNNSTFWETYLFTFLPKDG